MNIGSRVGSILARRSPAELAIMLLDRLVRPLGVSPLSYSRYAAIEPPSGGDLAETRFEEIAAANLWGSTESLSGQGSEIKQSSRYRSELTRFLKTRQIRSMLDAPCGDMNWMQLVLREVPLAYTGGDISPGLIELNRSRFPELEFTVFDITTSPFPSVDLWHCRDCLFHLSYADIFKALSNFANSEIPVALITNHTGMVRNVDVSTGGWRYLNLERAPFHLPKPSLYLNDYRFGDLPRKVGLWTREEIGSALSRR
jgi:SAM-dependent methyltransferase